jgi:hypothetical protein
LWSYLRRGGEISLRGEKVGTTYAHDFSKRLGPLL